MGELITQPHSPQLSILLSTDKPAQFVSKVGKLLQYCFVTFSQVRELKIPSSYFSLSQNPQLQKSSNTEKSLNCTQIHSGKCIFITYKHTYITNAIVTMSYTAVTGLQSFAHSRVCRCCRGFRFRHPQCFSHNTPTMQHALS